MWAFPAVDAVGSRKEDIHGIIGISTTGTNSVPDEQ